MIGVWFKYLLVQICGNTEINYNNDDYQNGQIIADLIYTSSQPANDEINL